MRSGMHRHDLDDLLQPGNDIIDSIWVGRIFEYAETTGKNKRNPEKQKDKSVLHSNCISDSGDRCFYHHLCVGSSGNKK